MAKKGFRLHSLLICDDIRREQTGKEILIGVYGANIIVKDVPATLPSLCFRVAFYANDVGRKSISFRIIAPSKKSLVVGASDMEVTDIDVMNVVVLPFKNPTFPEAGKYTVHFGIGGGTYKISEFSIKCAETDEDMKKLGV